MLIFVATMKSNANFILIQQLHFILYSNVSLFFFLPEHSTRGKLLKKKMHIHMSLKSMDLGMIALISFCACRTFAVLKENSIVVPQKESIYSVNLIEFDQQLTSSQVVLPLTPPQWYRSDTLQRCAPLLEPRPPLQFLRVVWQTMKSSSIEQNSFSAFSKPFHWHIDELTTIFLGHFNTLADSSHKYSQGNKSLCCRFYFHHMMTARMTFDEFLWRTARSKKTFFFLNLYITECNHRINYYSTTVPYNMNYNPILTH